MSDFHEAVSRVEAARVQVEFAGQAMRLSQSRDEHAALALYDTALTAIGIARRDLSLALDALRPVAA